MNRKCLLFVKKGNEHTIIINIVNPTFTPSLAVGVFFRSVRASVLHREMIKWVYGKVIAMGVTIRSLHIFV